MGFASMNAIAKLLGKKASGNSDEYLNEKGLATLISLLRQPVERKLYSWCVIDESTGNKTQYNTTSWTEGYTLKPTLGVNDIIMTGFINASDLPTVYTLISRDILDRAVNDSKEKITPDSIRQELKRMIEDIKDPDTLRLIGKVLITYTRDEDTKEERALLLQLANAKQ